MTGALLTKQRRRQLLEMVRSRGFASLPDLAQKLDVSESTIRRDLEYLERLGSAKRTHGGVFYTGAKPNWPHFNQRQSVAWEKKRQIARRAAQLIEDGDVVALDGGSTTYELALLLIDRPVQIVTNSLPVANLFAGNTSHELVLIGGCLHQSTGVLLGPHANEMLGRLNVRRAVLSVAGINHEGIFNSNLLLVETERAMMQAADEVIIVADSGKFGCRSLALLGPLSDIDKIVVDEQIEQTWREEIARSGAELIIAPAEPPVGPRSDDELET